MGPTGQRRQATRRRVAEPTSRAAGDAFRRGPTSAGTEASTPALAARDDEAPRPGAACGAGTSTTAAPVDPLRAGVRAADWHLYLLRCRDGTLYAGIATDVQRRFNEHAAGRGARYTRAHPPLCVLATRAYPDRSSALRAEHRLKRQPKARKLAWMAEGAHD